MDLNFVETVVGGGKEYSCEFLATSDFNLHIEREKNSSLIVCQRGCAEGLYDVAFTMGEYEGRRVIDYDFGALVYPKYIKVKSGSKVLKGVVTFCD